MKTGIKPPSVADICTKANMSVGEVNAFLNLLKRSMEPFSKRISVIENGTTRYYAVERRGIGILKTEHGKFWQYSFAIDDQWEKYSVIVKAELDKNLLIPVFNNKDRLVLKEPQKIHFLPLEKLVAQPKTFFCPCAIWIF